MTSSTYPGRHDIGAVAVRRAMTPVRIEDATSSSLEMAGALAESRPHLAAEYARHAASAIRAREHELSEMRRDQSAAIAAALRRMAVSA